MLPILARAGAGEAGGAEGSKAEGRGARYLDIVRVVRDRGHSKDLLLQKPWGLDGQGLGAGSSHEG